MVFLSGWTVIKENLPWLVDENKVAPETIYDIVLQVPDVIICHYISSWGIVGRQVFIEMHLVAESKDLETAHLITKKSNFF